MVYRHVLKAVFKLDGKERREVGIHTLLHNLITTSVCAPTIVISQDLRVSSMRIATDSMSRGVAERCGLRSKHFNTSCLEKWFNFKILIFYFMPIFTFYGKNWKNRRFYSSVQITHDFSVNLHLEQ
eukprot:Pompholyxophrys_sp_v1_NODE_127_length_1708_cov_39.354507.p2 type:complete len:126 gc:universal NODE_127_length_1708_cov_39.354507:1507-1130(-)